MNLAENNLSQIAPLGAAGHYQSAPGNQSFMGNNNQGRQMYQDFGVMP